tara:strand:+ start:583 stop:1020 length:438 start_codon:yes stop_codon:yes gene_type:complete
MIKGKISELINFIKLKDYELIVSYISNINDNEMPVGEWVKLNDEKLKAIILNSSNYSENVFESHKKYIDIHITLKGEDLMYIGNGKHEKLLVEYNEELDYSLYESILDNNYSIKEKQFIIINPGELHINEIKKPNTLKLVVKKLC